MKSGRKGPGSSKPRPTLGTRCRWPQNLLNREFQPAVPDQAWAGDITYVWTEEGWLYLAIFIDLFSRMVVGWSMSERMTSELVEAALGMGVARRGGRAPRLVHTDRGSQYASASFRELVEKVFSSQSMSRKGNCWDNAVAESFRERTEAGVGVSRTVPDKTRGNNGSLRLHRSVLQPEPDSLSNRISFTGRV